MNLRILEFQKLLFERNLSIPQLADAAEVKEDTIYTALKSAHRQIRWKTLLKICQVLQCEPAEIADLELAPGQGKE